jgi:F-type H+-transporting ATPase subunit epsilon
MSAPFLFELVSPEKLIVSKTVAMVTVPGGEGDYGVLAGHAPLITTVRPGVIEMYDDENGSPNTRMFVAGGFAEVTNERCTVLAEEAMPVEDLNRGTIEVDTKILSEALAAAKTDAEKASLETQLAVVQAKAQALATN